MNLGERGNRLWLEWRRGRPALPAAPFVIVPFTSFHCHYSHGINLGWRMDSSQNGSSMRTTSTDNGSGTGESNCEGKDFFTTLTSMKSCLEAYDRDKLVSLTVFF